MINKKFNNMKIDILGAEYLVQESKEPVVIEHRECYASVDYEKQVIHISDVFKVHAEMEEINLLHEITHAMLRQSRLYELSSNEDLVQAIAQGIHYIFNKNPELTKTLFNKKIF